MRDALRECQVTIEEASETRDANTNEVTLTWGTWRTAWVGLVARRGNEHFEAGQRYSEVVYRMTGDFYDLDGITTKMRVSYDGARYDIRSVLPDAGRHRDIVCDLTLQE